MNKLINIAGRAVGDEQPCFIIAEVGSNHNQNYDLAIEHIDAAAEAGVDAVKFQTFKAEHHISSRAEGPEYLEEKDLHKLIKSLELNREWQEDLQKHCQKRDVIFFSSPCDKEAVDQLEAINAPVHKIASFDLPDPDLVGYIAKTGKPTIFSTGLADWMDIQRGIDICRKAGNQDIIVLQCTSLYPAPVSLSNLKAMDSMRLAFDVLTGYSDHTRGDIVACAAVARGACMIEKHFTLDRSLPGPDHEFAMEPKELKIMVERIRETETAIGDGAKNGPRPEEQEMAEKGRRSLHAARPIKSGETITGNMLVIKRPGHGIPPYLREQLLGRKATRDIKVDEWIDWEMV